MLPSMIRIMIHISWVEWIVARLLYSHCNYLVITEKRGASSLGAWLIVDWSHRNGNCCVFVDICPGFWNAVPLMHVTAWRPSSLSIPLLVCTTLRPASRRSSFIFTLGQSERVSTLYTSRTPSFIITFHSIISFTLLFFTATISKVYVCSALGLHFDRSVWRLYVWPSASFPSIRLERVSTVRLQLCPLAPHRGWTPDAASALPPVAQHRLPALHLGLHAVAPQSLYHWGVFSKSTSMPVQCKWRRQPVMLTHVFTQLSSYQYPQLS